MKFFRRKQKERAEARQHYRRNASSKQALTVRILPVGRKEWVPAEVADTSAGGTAILVHKAKDPGLTEGAKLTLSFGSLRHAGEVLANSVVRVRIDGPTHTRYGCEFEDPSALLQGLDPYFLMFFNRRRDMRVRPDLGREMNADVRADDGGWRLKVHDVSPSGIGVVIGSEELPWMQANERLDVEFRVPKAEMSFMRFATRVHVTQISGALRAGLAFQEPEGGAGIELDALQKWITDRLEAMKQWDRSFD